MLQFLRKHQKFFFAIVTAVIIVSFCFFGTYGTMQREVEIPDCPIGKLIDDSPLMSQELELLTSFLSTSCNEHQLLEKGQMPNLLNDGVIQHLFLETGLLSLIAKPYFSEIAPELKERIDRVRTYRHYIHRDAPFLSCEAVWNRFFPGMKQEIQTLSKSSLGDEESLDLLGALYLHQGQLPTDVLRRILTYEQQQYTSLRRDDRLERIDLSMFGFQNLEEWLGGKLMRVIAQVILNGAAKAEREGYRVSEEEARRSLQQSLHHGITKTLSGRELKGEELYKIYQQQIHALHREERQVIAMWQKVLLFREMFEDVGASVILDASTHRAFSDFAREKLLVNTYELPEALHLKKFRDLLKLQTYLEAVAIAPGKKTAASLQLPDRLATVFDVLSCTPELVEHRFNAEIAEVHYEALALQVTLKQIYEWEMNEEHFELLLKEFPLLTNTPCFTIEDRYAALEKMAPPLRLQIDKMAREAIVRAHPEWLETAFREGDRRTISFGMRQKGGQIPFMGVSDRDRDILYISLKNAPIKTKDFSPYQNNLKSRDFGKEAPQNFDPERATIAERQGASEDRNSEVKPTQPKTDSSSCFGITPYRFSCDGYHHYEVVLTEPPSTLTLLSFEEASVDGTLDALLDKKLEESYPEIRKKNATFFQMTSGSFKPLALVKDQVGAYIYADLLKVIEAAAKEANLFWGNEKRDSTFKEPLEAYAHYRLYDYAQKALSSLNQEEEKENLFLEQFRLIKREEELTRAQARKLHIEQLFEQPDLSWSPLVSPESGKWTFFHLQKKKKSESQDVEQMVKTAQESLAKEAKRAFLDMLLREIVAKKSMSL